MHFISYYLQQLGLGCWHACPPLLFRLELWWSHGTGCCFSLAVLPPPTITQSLPPAWTSCRRVMQGKVAALESTNAQLMNSLKDSNMAQGRLQASALKDV